MKKTVLCLLLVLASVISLASCDMLGGIIGSENPEEGEHEHASSDWITDVVPTCTSEGSRYTKCTECDEVLVTETLAVGAHTPVEVPEKGATETEDGIAAGSVCGVCGALLSGMESIPAEISGTEIVIGGFERDDAEFRIRLGSDVSGLSLSGLIRVNSAASFRVSYDPDGNDVADLENIALEPGDNTLYITVVSDGESLTYTVVIHRALTYNVSFVFPDGTPACDTICVEEGGVVTLPELSRPGYRLATVYDLTAPITESTEIEVFWDGLGLSYTVLHYAENTSGEYELKESVTMYGELGETVSASPASYAGYEHNSALGTASGVITEDGSLTLSVYYRLKAFTVSIEGAESYLLNGEGSYRYGTEVSLSISYIPVGYDFIGWLVDGVSVSTESTYSTAITADIVAKFAVKDEMTPFIFRSNANECVIIGVLKSEWTSHTVPDYVTGIQTGAFSECTALTDITLLGAETAVDDGAFDGCPIERASAPAGALHALPKARLTELTVNGGGAIPASAMQSSKRLAILVIGDGVTEIGESAFANSRNLVSVTLGKDVEAIGDAAFSDNIKLREVVNLSSLTLYQYDNGNGAVARYAWSIDAEKSQIVRRDGYLFYVYERQQGVTVVSDRYLLAYVGQDTELTLPESPNDFLYIIHDYAFADLSDVKSVYIPESVLDVVYSTAIFSGCSSLESLSMPCHSGTMPTNSTDYQSIATLFGMEKYENSIATSQTVGNGTHSQTYYIPSGLKSLTLLGSKYGQSYIADGYLKTIPVIENVTVKSASPEGPMVSIATGAFICAEDLKSVVIDGWVSIYPQAFKACPQLVSISGEAASVSIGELAFENCTALKSVELADVLEIGKSAFSGCTALESVIIPSACAVRKSAFEGCTALKTAEIGATQYIDERAFYGCTLLSEYKLPSSLLEIGAYAFASCHSLESISFAECKNLAATGEYSFNDCPSLKSVTFGNYITELASNTFRYCTSLESITIPANLVTIGSYAFTNCTSLAEIVTEGTHVFKTDVFKECNKIERVYAPSLEAWLGNTFGDGILGGADLYLGGVLFTEFVLPTNVTTITNSAFEGCGSLTKVTLPAHATWFGTSIFSNCVNVKEVIIENGVTEIPVYAFLGCSSLDTVNIPSSVKKIGGGALGSCTSLKSIEIPSSVTEIGQKVFDGSALTEITIPGSISIIPKCAFQNCKSLKTVTLEEGVGKIVDSAFSGCTALESISIPASMSTVGSSAFSGCSGIDVYAVSLAEWLGISFSGSEANPLVGGGKLYFGGALAQELDITGVTALSMYAFEGAASIKSVTVRADVQTVGVYAFSGCTNLASIIIEEGVTSIGYYAFKNCSSLKEIHLPASAALGENPLAGCTSLERAVLGNSVPSFSGCTALKEVIIGEGVTELALVGFNGCTALETIVIPTSMTNMIMLSTPHYQQITALTRYYGNLNLTVYYLGESIDGYIAIKNAGIMEPSGENVYLYSADEPVTDGIFWHYGDNGEILKW